MAIESTHSFESPPRVLDYAPRPKGREIGRAILAILMTLAWPVAGAAIGAALAWVLAPRQYVAQAFVYVDPLRAGSAQRSSVLPTFAAQVESAVGMDQEYRRAVRVDVLRASDLVRISAAHSDAVSAAALANRALQRAIAQARGGSINIEISTVPAPSQIMPHVNPRWPLAGGIVGMCLGIVAMRLRQQKAKFGKVR